MNAVFISVIIACLTAQSKGALMHVDLISVIGGKLATVESPNNIPSTMSLSKDLEDPWIDMHFRHAGYNPFGENEIDNICEADTSTAEGTIREILMKSVNDKCPTQAGDYTFNVNFNVTGPLDGIFTREDEATRLKMNIMDDDETVFKMDMELISITLDAKKE